MKKTMKTILMASAFAMMSTFAAFASDISSISISMVEDKADPGTPFSAVPEVSSNAYEITDISVSRPYEDWIAGSKVTFEVTLEPTEDNKFDNRAKVTVRGANSELVTKGVTSREANVRINYIPRMTLPEPENLYWEDDMYAKWDKVNSAQYEVVIYKEDEDANMRKYKTVKVTKPEIDLMDYVTDGSAATFEVRSIPKTDKAGKYISPSAYVSIDELSSSYYMGGDSDGWVNGANGTYYYTDANNKRQTGFQEINGTWYYFDPNQDGKALTNTWAFLDNHWWYFNNQGIMQVGWLYKDGLWYYLNTNHDGTYGAMLTGWIRVGENGPYYYLNSDPNNGRVYGAMYADEMTPDGYYVDASGAWNG